LLAGLRPALRWPRRLRVDPLLPFTGAVLVLLAAIAQINPVWLIGPSQPGNISSGSVPDWYMAFLDGTLRVMPAWEVSIGGHPLALGVLISGLLVPGLFFTALAMYPVADQRLLTQAAGDRANRAAAGVAGLTLYGLLWAAAANDEIAYHLHIDLFTVTWMFRILVLAGPVLTFAVTRVLYHTVAGQRRDEEQHGRETGRIVMDPQGG